MELKKLNEMIEKYRDLKAEYSAASKVKSDLDAQVKALGEEISAILEVEGMTSYKSPIGTFGWRNEQYVRISDNTALREKFFNYLKERGIFFNMASVHSQTLNSWFKKEEEASEELDFNIPGIEKGNTRLVCSFRKG